MFVNYFGGAESLVLCLKKGNKNSQKININKKQAALNKKITKKKNGSAYPCHKYFKSVIYKS